MGLFDSILLTKLLGQDIIDKAEGEFNEIKDEWNRRHRQNFEDHRRIAELLGEVLKRLDEIEKQVKKR